jgi:putative acetyltransferase
MITIRKEQDGDEEQIRLVNTRAFGENVEAGIVDTLRRTCPEGFSLVALHDGKIAGHILFTPTAIVSGEKNLHGMGLAPMSVLPELQRQGIGSALVRAGIEEMRRAAQPFVIVLGHPAYYPRFGFVPASHHEITSEYDGVPDEGFMILVLDEFAMAGVTGTAKYRAEFAAAV